MPSAGIARVLIDSVADLKCMLHQPEDVRSSIKIHRDDMKFAVLAACCRP